MAAPALHFEMQSLLILYLAHSEAVDRKLQPENLGSGHRARWRQASRGRPNDLKNNSDDATDVAGRDVGADIEVARREELVFVLGRIEDCDHVETRDDPC